MTKSKIQWTNHTWNPVVGCSLVSPGCTHCYAMKAAHRMGHNPKTPQYQGLTEVVKGNPVWTGQVRLHEPALRKPLAWSKPRRVFVNSMGDLFHEDVPDHWIDRVFAVMALCPQHSFQVLTKRAERMRDYVTNVTLERIAKSVPTPSNLPVSKHRTTAAITGMPEAAAKLYGYARPAWPLPNVWLGVSAEDQKRANERIPLLLETPAAVRFVSAEPLLGPIDFFSTLGGTLWLGGQRGCDGTHQHRGRAGEIEHGVFHATDPRRPHHHHDERCGPGLDWIIAGGESGPNARPMHPDWVRGIRDQCIEAGTAFFFKQWGEWIGEPDLRHLTRGPGFGPYDSCTHDMEHEAIRIGKKAAGADLDGRPWEQYPATTAPNSENGR